MTMVTKDSVVALNQGPRQADGVGSNPDLRAQGRQERIYKALTICQPYAHLIALHRKRVENRTWPTAYRGPLLIHAGKSREWLDDDGDGTDYSYNLPISEMAFGAVVAIAELSDCIEHADLFGPHGKWDRKYPWLREHEHTEGPWCWVLTDVRRLPEPIPARGALGLFDLKVTI